MDKHLPFGQIGEFAAKFVQKHMSQNVLTLLCHTCGLGSKIGSMNLDLSYQYSATDGDFYPFQSNITGSVPSASVSNKRHQVLLTLGYTF